jgi:sugar (pentulose or hexulose) kinase
MSKEMYFAGIDVGTSYIKAVIINKKKKSLVRSQFDPVQIFKNLSILPLKEQFLMLTSPNLQ